MNDLSTILKSRDVEAFRSGLPQGNVLQESDILSWMERVEASNDFHDAGWHYRRLTGIGGSESGHAVQQAVIDNGGHPERYRGRWSRHLVLEKLLIIPSESANAAMLRGNRFEQMIADRFLELHQAIIRTDLMEAVVEVNGQIGNHPWLVGNPDLIVELRNGEIALVDIKAPSQPTRKAAPEYVAQLHHYRRLMVEARIPPNRMILGNFNWPEYDINTVEVPFDRVIDERLRRGGDSLWQRILDGKPPESAEVNWPRPKWERFSKAKQEKIRERIVKNEEHYLFARMTADRAKKRADAISRKIRDDVAALGPAKGIRAKDYGLSIVTLPTTSRIDKDAFQEAVESMGLSRSVQAAYVPGEKWDADRMAERLKDLGEDPEQFRKKEIDEDKALALLERAGVDYGMALSEGIVIETPSPTFRRPTKGDARAVFEDMSEIADAIDSRLEKDIERARNDDLDEILGSLEAGEEEGVAPPEAEHAENDKVSSEDKILPDHDADKPCDDAQPERRENSELGLIPDAKKGTIKTYTEASWESVPPDSQAPDQEGSNQTELSDDELISPEAERKAREEMGNSQGRSARSALAGMF